MSLKKLLLIFKQLSVVKNCLRPKNAPLMFTAIESTTMKSC